MDHLNLTAKNQFSTNWVKFFDTAWTSKPFPPHFKHLLLVASWIPSPSQPRQAGTLPRPAQLGHLKSASCNDNSFFPSFTFQTIDSVGASSGSVKARSINDIFA
jgi:hypothetical protein